MADSRPVRECGPPDWLAAALSKAETNKRKRAEEERLERLAVNRAVAASLLLPPPARMHVRVPDRLQELEDEIRAAAPEPPPLPVVMAYYPAAAEEARVSAVEYKLLAKIRDVAPCGAVSARIAVLEKFLLPPEDQGGVGRLAKLEAAVETIEYEATLEVERTFY
jgi:hypothetical protein